MLKPHKRITKRQLKQDKFVTYYFKAVDFVEKNSRQILSALGAAAVISLAIFIYSEKQAESEGKAVVELAKATKEYANGNYETAATILKNLLDTYGGAESATLAKFYLANTNFELKNYNEAEKYYREFADASDDKELTASALSGLAACLEAQGKFKEAAERYQQTAEKYKDEFFAAENLYHSARCYLLSGDRAAANALLNRLIENYPDSDVEADAQLLLAELTS